MIWLITSHRRPSSAKSNGQKSPSAIYRPRSAGIGRRRPLQDITNVVASSDGGVVPAPLDECAVAAAAETVAQPEASRVVPARRGSRVTRVQGQYAQMAGIIEPPVRGKHPTKTQGEKDLERAEKAAVAEEKKRVREEKKKAAAEKKLERAAQKANAKQLREEARVAREAAKQASKPGAGGQFAGGWYNTKLMEILFEAMMGLDFATCTPKEVLDAMRQGSSEAADLVTKYKLNTGKITKCVEDNRRLWTSVRNVRVNGVKIMENVSMVLKPREDSIGGGDGSGNGGEALAP